LDQQTHSLKGAFMWQYTLVPCRIKNRSCFVPWQMSMLERDVIQHSHFQSLAEFGLAVGRYLAYYNAQCHPFRWGRKRKHRVFLVAPCDALCFGPVLQGVTIQYRALGVEPVANHCRHASPVGWQKLSSYNGRDSRTSPPLSLYCQPGDRRTAVTNTRQNRVWFPLPS